MNLLSKKEAAGQLGIGVRTLEKLMAERQVAHVKIGGRVLFEPGELQRFVRASTTATAERISPKQRARFHAQSDHLDQLGKLKPGTTKTVLKAWAAARFGRGVDSVNDLSYDEASDLLDELRGRIDAANEQRRLAASSQAPLPPPSRR